MSYGYRSALCGHPNSSAYASEQWNRRAASRHTTAPTSYTRPSTLSLLLICHPVEGRRLS